MLNMKALLASLLCFNVTCQASLLEASDVSIRPPIGYIVYCSNSQSIDCGFESRNEIKDIDVLKINAVNLKINQSIQYVSDQELYGVPEKWVEATTRGDCEDIAIRKFNELVKIGVDPKRLRYAFVRREGIGHLVLLWDGREHTFVLDNNADYVYKWDSVPEYKFIKVQVPNSTEWRVVK